MRRVIKGLLVFVFLTCNFVLSAEYRVLVLPDNISSKQQLDAIVYEDSAEFFASQVINKLNLSNTIESPTVSEVREALARNPRLNIATRDSLMRFKKGYNINYMNLKKLAAMFNTNKVLLITTGIDAQNYFMRRTFWDFLNIPGATVIDPAIKLSTYAVLVDTDRDVTLWEDTFYKTISSCENRMVANQLGPQTVQLEKIRDYSKMLGPQIAHYVQACVVPSSIITRKNEINYGPKDFDNVFTKKYKWYRHGAGQILKESNNKYIDYRQSQEDRGIENLPQKFQRWKQEWKEKQAAMNAQRAEEAKIRKEQKRIEKEQKKLKEQINKQEHDNNIQNVNNIVTPEKKDILKESVNTTSVDDKQSVLKNSDKNTVVEQKVIEVQDIQPAVQIKEEKLKRTDDEPKMLNVVKEEHIKSEIVEPVNEPQIKHYQPKQRYIPNIKNTTINDI